MTGSGGPSPIVTFAFLCQAAPIGGIEYQRALKPNHTAVATRTASQFRSSNESKIMGLPSQGPDNPCAILCAGRCVQLDGYITEW